MEKIVAQILLFDFYGELLTEHQQNVYQDAVLEDMSLSEVADNYGISRQGVHDLLKRCDKSMQDFEDKLHLISKFDIIREKLKEIQRLTDDKRVHQLATEIL